MPRNFIDTSGPGSSSQWTVVGASDWEAVSRSSDDSTYLSTAVPADITDVFCGSGWATDGGRIMALTLHYRIRRTTATPAEIHFAVTRDAVSHSIGGVSITDSGWVDGHVRIRFDWISGVRFRRSEIIDLGIEVTATTVPVAGELQISKLWLEIEYVDTYMFYDPVDGVVPDAGTGDKAWMVIGTQPYSINADTYLEIVDTSAVDYGAFIYPRFLDLTPKYVTEFEARYRFTGPLADVVYASLVILFSDRFIELVVARFGGQSYIGFPQGDSANDMTTYRAIQPFDFFSTDFHIRVTVDRDMKPDNPGKVRCYINYNDIPFLETRYLDFNESMANWNFVGFGTNPSYPDATVTMEVDYFAWKHYLKRGDTFRHWTNLTCGTNLIYGDVSDPDVVKPILIDPPGIYAGQSRHCCCLDVQDPTVDCAVHQVKLVPV